MNVEINQDSLERRREKLSGQITKYHLRAQFDYLLFAKAPLTRKIVTLLTTSYSGDRNRERLMESISFLRLLMGRKAELIPAQIGEEALVYQIRSLVEIANFTSLLHHRFYHPEEHYNTPTFQKLQQSLAFSEVQKALIARPEFLKELMRMEEKGGQPNLCRVTDKAFVFCDFVKEVAEDRCDMPYIKALQKAEEGEIYLQGEEGWRAFQELGSFDRSVSIWLKSPYEEMSGGPHVLIGGRDEYRPNVYHYPASNHNPKIGYRTEVIIPRA